MIEREDIEHDIFILRLIIQRKYGVEGKCLSQTMSKTKRRLPKRAHKTADRIVELYDQVGPNGTDNKEKIQELEQLTEGLVDDLVYYSPQEVRIRKMNGGRLEAIVHLGIAGILFAFFLTWQGLI